jgi:DNA-binding CsgD family transcriptional regulator
MKTVITSFRNDIVIQKYLNGKTLDQIVKETNLSKGTVYNLVKRWKDKLGSIVVEEIREFATVVSKSGMTIQQCAQGFRIVQILRELGINDEFEDGDDFAPEQDLLESIRNGTTDWEIGKNDNDPLRSPSNGLTERRGRRNKDALTKNNFHHFIEDIYNNSKKYNIKPSDFIRFIKDLLDFFHSLECGSPFAINKDNDLCLSNENEDESDIIIYLDRLIKGEFGNDIPQNFEIKGDTLTKQVNKPDASIEIPFVSQVSYYINQIKLELKEQEKYRKFLNIDISFLENKKSALEINLGETTSKNNNILAHLQWYDFLKQELSDNYNMNLDEEIIFFSSIINDFKTHNYNILDILKEYKQIQSLRKERDRIQYDINLNTPLHQDLLKQIASTNSQLDISTQTMKIYRELDGMGFNLKKLKQLYGTIIEIAIANHILPQDAVPKFLNDIENQYDNKLGFETKIKELSAKIDELENEIPHHKSNLLIQSQVASLLLHLANNE